MIRAGAGSSVWRFTMAFTGIGSTMLGPFLPHLHLRWQLPDHQSGMLVASLFLGSFSGTLLLSERLVLNLRLGAWTAAAGCALFAWSTALAHGFGIGLLALLLLGFGMGQLMSSINLLVGTAPAAIRSRQLANLGAAWCVGAIFSPLVSTILFHGFSPALRLGLLALLFLLPLIATPDSPSPQISSAHNGEDSPRFMSYGLLVCITAFLLYGGIEASINAWVPSFAARYSGGTLAASQWTLSLFWLGLIVGRMLMASFLSPAQETFLLRAATIGSCVCLFSLLFLTSILQICVGAAFLGVCIAPAFPLLLSTTLASGYSNRAMGVMLASCALGSAFFPWLLGVLSSLFSLRSAMALPILCLAWLTISRWNRPQRIGRPLLIHSE